MTSNNVDLNAQIEHRFPQFLTKERIEYAGLTAIVLSHEHKVERYPCYNYGFQIGDDISHSFRTELLLLPQHFTKETADCFVIVRISGYSNYSERYDQNSVSVSCELGSGEILALEDYFYYEKYPFQDKDTKTSPLPLLQYMRQHLGMTNLEEQMLQAWLSHMRSSYSF